MGQRKITRLLILFIITFLSFPLHADELPTKYHENQDYKVQPGDILDIMVWKEEDLQKEVLVRPDGHISFPLAGDVSVQGKSLNQIQKYIKTLIDAYIPNSVVTVSAKQLSGNKIFVVGKVNKPGEFTVTRNVDVMQALSMAGGVTTFAAVNDIIVLRRDETGKQKAIEFNYGDVEDGDDLVQNIILKPGDVVVVP